MTALTPELRQAVELAGDQPVEITDPQTNAAYFLLKADVYKRTRDLGGRRGPSREGSVDEARPQGTIRVGRGESLLMITPGEIYVAGTDAGIRPVVVVSREELNRGNWIVAVLITSARLSSRIVAPSLCSLPGGRVRTR